MQSKLFIKNLEVFAYHGLFNEENKLGQKFIFDVECDVNYTKALFSDDMNDSISYASIADIVIKTATENTFNLLERLTGEIVKNIFNKFSEVTAIKLEINKPNAPLKYSFDKCGTKLTITRVEFDNLL
ncbi:MULTISPECIES: dihydroneopterin aldolase [Gemella]|uniref:dihydroneopterin aldolase n=1 Tax=Gemella TaxID=1378 RepID=UPI0007680865|nr:MULTISPECIES: dihydroneopterin aldolase [Gemella]AME09847.1 dihydroneopterin aldolase [Gemella sp. oral taxon 928]AXI25986.1 dihydroneopterin aldolase [Gemella sp. ND 6198]